MSNDFDKAVAEMIERAQISTLKNVLSIIRANDMNTVSQVTGLIHDLVDRLEGDSDE